MLIPFTYSGQIATSKSFISASFSSWLAWFGLGVNPISGFFHYRLPMSPRLLQVIEMYCSHNQSAKRIFILIKYCVEITDTYITTLLLYLFTKIIKVIYKDIFSMFILDVPKPFAPLDLCPAFLVIKQNHGYNIIKSTMYHDFTRRNNII